MENFNWTTFTKRIAIQATLADMYDAWTIPEKIETWFLKKAVYKRPNGSNLPKDVRFTIGDQYEWHWYLFEGIEKGKITASNEKDFIQFQFANSLVEVHLSELEGNILVTLTQKDIPTDDDSKRDIRLGCEKGWTFFLLNLKTVYENGIDQRNKDERLIGMINN